MRIPVNSNSLTEQPGVASAPSPEVVTVQHHLEDAMETRSKIDFISDRASNEWRKPIVFSTPIRWSEIVGACEGHVVQEVDLTDTILGCRFNGERNEPGVLSSPQEEQDELPELLDFSIDVERMLACGESLQQDRPKGKLLNFEVPAHMKTVSPAKLVNSSDSTGTAAKVIEFRRP